MSSSWQITRNQSWQGVALVVLSAFAFSTAGFFTRLIDTDVWTMLFWRGLFGGLFIAGYIVWRHGAEAALAFRRIGRAGLVVAGCSTLATICFINALRETTVADVLVINATAPFLTAALAWAWTGDRERWTTLAASVVALAGRGRHGRGGARVRPPVRQLPGASHDHPDLDHDGGDPPLSRRQHAAGRLPVGLPVRARRLAVGAAR